MVFHFLRLLHGNIQSRDIFHLFYDHKFYKWKWLELCTLHIRNSLVTFLRTSYRIHQAKRSPAIWLLAGVLFWKKYCFENGLQYRGFYLLQVMDLHIFHKVVWWLEHHNPPLRWTLCIWSKSLVLYRKCSNHFNLTIWKTLVVLRWIDVVGFSSLIWIVLRWIVQKTLDFILLS